MSNSDNPYILSDIEHQEIRDVIISENLERCQSREQPRAFITGGQPGAGKSNLADIAKAQLIKEGGYLVIDADRYRRKHPIYGYLQKTDPIQAANFVHKDAAQWAGELKRAGISERHNLLVDQTSKDPQALINLGDDLRKNGYQVELHVMAVNELISEQRIYSRYETQFESYGFGRFSTKDNHDYAYNTLPLSVEAVEQSQSVDKIVIYDKDHKVIYSNELKNGEWSNPVNARTALEQERDKPMTLADKKEYARTYEKLVEMVSKPERKATVEEVKKLQSLSIKANAMVKENILSVPISERPQAVYKPPVMSKGLKR